MSAGSHFHRGDAVLVVDDEPALRELLRRRGCTVLPAATVAEAIEQLERAPVDAIVGDCSRPGAPALNLLAYVRARGLRTRFVRSGATPPSTSQRR